MGDLGFLSRSLIIYLSILYRHIIKKGLFFQIQFVTLVYEQLQELNFELEVEHCSSLQDVDILDTQLYKYQSLLKSEEVQDIQICLCCRAVISAFSIDII